jgi:hypothetical protein
MAGEYRLNHTNNSSHVDNDHFSTPYAIVDGQNHIIAMLRGRPKDGNWDRVVEEMTRALLGAGEQANLKLGDLSHHRGGQTVRSLFISLFHSPAEL